MLNARTPTADRIAFLRAMPYTAYLSTPEWRRRRNRALALADWRCEWEGCDGTENLIVHHRSYELLGAEPDADLQVLCAAHHHGVHARYEHLCRVHWRVIRDVINTGPFASFADFVEEVKTRLAALHLRLAPTELHDMLSATLRDVALDVPTHLRRVDVQQSPAHISEAEARAVLAELRIDHLVPSMPTTDPVQHEARVREQARTLLAEAAQEPPRRRRLYTPPPVEQRRSLADQLKELFP